MTKFSKKSPLSLAKSTLNTGMNVLGRAYQTASVAGLSALRVAKGEKMDSYLLKETFEKLGVTYIKLGQFIASTPSLFPKEYVEAFADCLDNTTPVSFLSIKKVLDNELVHLGGADGVFASIDPIPLASASIAQVHKGILKTGQSVAIKVQKPSVETIIHTDLSVLQGGFWAVEKLIPHAKFANLAPIMDEIKSRMLAETDFVQERRHLNHFLQFLQQHHITHITAPMVFDELSSKKVLVMEFLDGISLVDEQTMAELAKTHALPAPAQIMASVLDTWFLSLIKTGQFHADLHAGNLLLLKTGQVAFLDFGLVGVINPSALAGCMSLVQALQGNDFQAMAKAMADIGMTKHAPDTARLADDLRTLLGQGATFGNLAGKDELNTLLAHLTSIGKRHGIHFPKDFALLAKQMLYFDRFMLTLAPEMDLFGDGRMQMIQKP